MTFPPRRFRAASALAAGILVAAAFVQPALAEMVERIAAVVNDEIILYSDVVAAAQTWQAMIVGIRDPEQRTARQQEVYRKVLDSLIEDRLLEQQLKELGIKVSDREIDEAIERVMTQNRISDKETFRMALSRQGIDYQEYRDNIAKELRKWQFISARFGNKVKISDEEVRSAWEKEQAMSGEEYEYRASHVLFRVTKDDPPEKEGQQREKAEAARTRVLAGEGFAAVARETSEAPNASFGGDLGYFREGVMMKEFEDAVVALKVGEVSPVVRTPFGFHVILLADKRPVPSRTFEEAREELREKLRQQEMNREMATWLKQLRQKAYVDVKLDRPPKDVAPPEEKGAP
ncbi:MAG: hypothetical protein C4523_21495 [Myxococcales bacterium]|nr:MAG: hypothetical protein C4523_21495 [Myxococcales bacterium]